MKFVFFRIFPGSENGENGLGDEGVDGGNAPPPPPRNFGLAPSLPKSLFFVAAGATDNHSVTSTKIA